MGKLEKGFLSTRQTSLKHIPLFLCGFLSLWLFFFLSSISLSDKILRLRDVIALGISHSKIMEYKGYKGLGTFDNEAKIFHGEAIGLKDMITFWGTTQDELEKAFKDSINDYLEFCKKKGRTPETLSQKAKIRKNRL